ncbi:DUF3313 domain-containing protein [Paraburkholderia sp. MMS20-SJTN17]|uniref:DUF3313 domain-containing protein n=1 Tax=Paraburkholderia translucens TaxID=2886945 RepID=A0ABS8KEX5_9BURK|nr:DUF3313 domain-containing protein [Paraburkholderia sp. MMS20-SJTN17]MCC8403232.1 DUF3313 domain-containing protein [Paraburkholderia sp. MMS20-SJTN17]
MLKRICLLLAVTGLVACATTSEQSLSDVDKATRSGFLTDPSLLKPGKEGEARLRYVKPGVDWSSYTGIFLEPVVFISDANAKVDAKEQQILASYYYNALRTHLSKVLPIVEQQGPHVLVVRAALTNVTSSTPGLRTISLIVPQARLLDSAQSLATDSYAFVGSAQSEGEVTDGGTGQILIEGVDGRSGGMSLKDVGGGVWDDAEKAMDYWAQLAATRLTQLKSGAPAS